MPWLPIESGGLLGRWGALIVLCMTMFIVVLDTSMMDVAVPQITRDLNTTVSSVQFVITLYSLVMASLMLASAKLGKMFCGKKVFRIAMVIYGAGTLLATFSWNIEILALGWSVIEGIAAAALALAALGVFVVLAFFAALFLPVGKLSDDAHAFEDESGRFERRAPTPSRPL